jgi:hypothetical protein
MRNRTKKCNHIIFFKKMLNEYAIRKCYEEYGGMTSANNTCGQTSTQDKEHIRRVIGIFFSVTSW